MGRRLALRGRRFRKSRRGEALLAERKQKPEHAATACLQLVRSGSHHNPFNMHAGGAKRKRRMVGGADNRAPWKKR